jgi:hypothetical protein
MIIVAASSSTSQPMKEDTWDARAEHIAAIAVEAKRRLGGSASIEARDLDAYSTCWRELGYVVDVYVAGRLAIAAELPGFWCPQAVRDGVRSAAADASLWALTWGHATALCSSLTEFLVTFAEHGMRDCPERRARVAARFTAASDASAEALRQDLTAALDPARAAEPEAWLSSIEEVFACSVPEVVAAPLVDLVRVRKQVSRLALRAGAGAPTASQMQCWTLAIQALGAIVALAAHATGRGAAHP